MEDNEAASAVPVPVVRVLILDIDRAAHNWSRLFDEAQAEFKGVMNLEVHCSSWENCSLSCYSDSGCVVTLVKKKVVAQGDGEPSIISSSNTFRITRNDYVLVRTLPRSSAGSSDYRTVLYGLMYCGVQGINNLYSIYCCLERPIIYGALLELQHKIKLEKDEGEKIKEAEDEIPLLQLIEQVYYPTWQDMQFTPAYPLVVKAGHSHAGYGKMRLADNHQFEDFASVMALYGDYCTAEPFIQAQYDIRIQRIGQHTRAYKRVSSHEWKGNVGSAIIEEIEVLPRYRKWADQCATLLGGLDIFAIDLVVDKEGKETILELNDSSIGLVPDNEEADMKNMRNIVLDKVLKRAATFIEKKEEEEAIEGDDTSETHLGELLEHMTLLRRQHQAEIAALKKELAEAKTQSQTSKGIDGRQLGCVVAVVLLGVVASALWQKMKH